MRPVFLLCTLLILFLSFTKGDLGGGEEEVNFMEEKLPATKD